MQTREDFLRGQSVLASTADDDDAKISKVLAIKKFSEIQIGGDKDAMLSLEVADDIFIRSAAETNIAHCLRFIS